MSCYAPSTCYALGTDSRKQRHGGNVVEATTAHEGDSASKNPPGLLARELSHVLNGQPGPHSAAGPGTPDACPGYEAGEREKSKTSKGVLPDDIWDLEPGKLLIADFAVGQAIVKAETAASPALIWWLARFEQDTSYMLKLAGYDDCVGEPSSHAALRASRAKSVLGLLGPSAASRVGSIAAAAPETYAAGNESAGARAQNRGVVIEFEQHVEMPAAEITAAPPRSAVETADCSKTEADDIARAMPLAKTMVKHAMKVVAARRPGVHVLAKKYFNDDSDHTLTEVWRGLRKIAEGLDWGVKYECEHKGDLMYNHFCGATGTAYVRALVGYRIHLCERAFGRSNPDLAETILHENSHMFDFTDDEQYCSLTSGCPGLSTSDAVDNADSYSTFALDAYLNLP